MTAVRLQRYLASAGVAARRKAEDLIVAGRVTVNGQVARVLGTKIDPDRDTVAVDGEAVAALDHFYVVLNKPKACITAVSDDRGRPTVMDYLPNVPVPVKPVGRLDFYTEGVLLLTNDGELAARLLAPASHVAKTYHVKIHGKLGPEQVRQLRDGIQLDDGTTTMPAEVAPLPGESKHTWLAITIHEGKHRQIHRMIEALGFAVDKLQRVAFANLTFHGLRIGDARELDQQELNTLRDLVGLDHSAVARGRWRADREATDIPRRARAKARDEAEAGAAAPTEPPPPAPERRSGQGRTFGKRAPSRDPGPRPSGRPGSVPPPRGPRGSRFEGPRGAPRPDRDGGHAPSSRGRPPSSARPSDRNRPASSGRPSDRGRPASSGRPSGRSGPTASPRGRPASGKRSPRR